MGKFLQDARELLAYVGGKENISAVSHCVTRMRFVLVDPEKADRKKIEAIKSVKGSFTQAGQFQVIIGNEVSSFFNDFKEVSGIEGVSKDKAKETARQNLNMPASVIIPKYSTLNTNNAAVGPVLEKPLLMRVSSVSAGSWTLKTT